MRLQKMIIDSELKNRVKNLPLSPGVYIMKNSDDKIIYIGKAKNLKNRVSSYFISDAGHSEKVKKMVSNIHHFDYIITDSEFEALVLECSLIKKNQPKYNILLKDGKGYSYIKITNEKWPRIYYTKQKENDGSTYIGPYVNSFSVKKAVEEASKIFKLPTCSRNFEHFFKRPCLNHYIGRCCAPCIKAVSNDDYCQTVNEAIRFLSKGVAETLGYLTEKMEKASESLDFEKAAKLRDKIKAIKDIKANQKVVSYKIKEQDVIACATDKNQTAFEVFSFRNGDLCADESFIMETENSAEDTRSEFLKSYYAEKKDIPKNIIIDETASDLELIQQFFRQKYNKAVTLSVPQKGEQLSLIKMCKANAEETLLRSHAGQNAKEAALEELKSVLDLPKLPAYIEAYDISNIRGSDNVGGMVVFENGSPLKSDYKKFKINTVYGQDDYHSMKEVLQRRIKNYRESSHGITKKGFERLPDIILIDGGKTHTKAVMDVLRSENLNIPVFGMVKDNHHRTRALTTDKIEINIKSYTRVFSFITKVQDEVHRFAIGYHKNLRSKKIRGSTLTDIPGIGAKRATALLKFFGSVKAIAQAPSEELQKAPGITLPAAKSIYVWFRKQ